MSDQADRDRRLDDQLQAFLRNWGGGGKRYAEQTERDVTSYSFTERRAAWLVAGADMRKAFRG